MAEPQPRSRVLQHAPRLACSSGLHDSLGMARRYQTPRTARAPSARLVHLSARALGAIWAYPEAFEHSQGPAGSLQQAVRHQGLHALAAEPATLLVPRLASCVYEEVHTCR